MILSLCNHRFYCNVEFSILLCLYIQQTNKIKLRFVSSFTWNSLFLSFQFVLNEGCTSIFLFKDSKNRNLIVQ